MSIRAIMFARLVCGLYYTGSSGRGTHLARKIFCVFSALYCTVHIFAIQYYYIQTSQLGPEFLKIIVQFSNYFLNFIVNFVYAGEYFFEFRRKLTVLDVEFNPKPPDDTKWSTTLFITLILQKVVSFAVLCNSLGSQCRMTISFLLASAMVQFTMALSTFTKIMMFECLYSRMKSLRKRFERDLSVARRFEDGEKVVINNLRKCMDIYSNLLDTIRISKKPMNILVFFSTAAVVPRSVLLAYEFINSTIEDSWIFILDTAMELVLPFIPGILVELISSDVDKIRLLIVKQLLVYRVSNAYSAIVNALRYMDHRPFKVTVWRMLEIDLTLLLSVIGLITTYTIAMIQFTHIYD